MMVTHVLPFPPAAGNEIRIFRMLMWFKKVGFRVTLVLRPLCDEEVSNECVAGLCGVVDDLYIFDTRFSAHSEIAEFFPTDAAERRPHLVEMQGGFCPPWFVAELDALVREKKPDVLIAQYIFMSRIFLSDSAMGALKVIDTHDLFSQKQATVEKYRISNFGLMITPDDEASLLERADLLVAIQRLELESIKSMAPQRKAVLAGFDVDIFYPDVSMIERGVVLIVASSNEFNVCGTQDFLDYTWPLIRLRCPFARLRVVGKVCCHVRSYDKSVEMIGFVRDLSNEYSRASVVVNPCGVGTGLKIKTVEALSWGKAHVGWPASADGLREIDDLPYVVAHDAVEFADAVGEFLVNQELVLDAARNAHEFSERHFGGEAVYGPLVAEIESFVMSRASQGVRDE